MWAGDCSSTICGWLLDGAALCSYLLWLGLWELWRFHKDSPAHRIRLLPLATSHLVRPGRSVTPNDCSEELLIFGEGYLRRAVGIRWSAKSQASV
jgi:hypothetical protein